MGRRRLPFIAGALVLLLAGVIVVTVMRSDDRSARAASPAATGTPTIPITSPNQVTPPSGGGPPAPPGSTATPLPEAPREPFVTATHCSVTVITPAGQPFHVIGPGSFEGDIPAPGDYVRDNCTGAVFFRDPTTGAELPSTQIGD